jgi:uncharacterized phiE125 gp8 family phage protein
MGLIQTLAPALEPLTTAEVISHLRLDSSNLEPVPDAPTCALAGLGAGNVDNGAHRYRVVFVTADGKTDGGVISGAIAVADKTVDGKIALSNIPLGGSRVTAREVYRTKAGLDNFFLVVTLNDNLATTYIDNLADAALGAGCPIVNTTSDPQLNNLIRTAREVAELSLGRALITSQWKLVLDCFPSYPADEIKLPRPNLISVESVQYRDFSGAQQTLDPTIYTVDTDSLPGRIVRNFSRVWPPTVPQRNAVWINFTAGYGATRDRVPQAIKQGMLLLIGEMYENPESLNVGNIVSEMPTLKRLWGLHQYKEMY